MYKIIVKKFGDEPKELLANSYEELRAVVTLCPEVDYEIISVEKINYDLASEFLEELKEKTKPKDLVFGVESGDNPAGFYKTGDDIDSFNIGDDLKK